MKNKMLELLEGIDATKVLAMINRLGGREIWDRVESGELTVRVEIVGGTKQAVVVKRVNKLFDRYGRLIPRGIIASHADPNRNFRLEAPKGGWAKCDFVRFNLPARVARLARFIPSDSGLTLPTAEEVCGFLARCEEIRIRVRGDKLTANVLNGPNLPTFLPKFEIEDLGTFVEILVTITKLSYEAQFPGRTFFNHRAGDLAGKVSVVEASRFQQVIAEMANGPVCGLNFPTPFQGFSIPADHEAIALLPEEFVLSGLDTIVSWALYPDILLSSWNTPGYDLAAFFWGSSSYSLYGKAHVGSADFRGGDLGASDYCSAGLFLSR